MAQILETLNPNYSGLLDRPRESPVPYVFGELEESQRKQDNRREEYQEQFNHSNNPFGDAYYCCSFIRGIFWFYVGWEGCFDADLSLNCFLVLV